MAVPPSGMSRFSGPTFGSSWESWGQTHHPQGWLWKVSPEWNLYIHVFEKPGLDHFGADILQNFGDSGKPIHWFKHWLKVQPIFSASCANPRPRYPMPPWMHRRMSLTSWNAKCSAQRLQAGRRAMQGSICRFVGAHGPMMRQLRLWCWVTRWRKMYPCNSRGFVLDPGVCKSFCSMSVLIYGLSIVATSVNQPKLWSCWFRSGLSTSCVWRFISTPSIACHHSTNPGMMVLI